MNRLKWMYARRAKVNETYLKSIEAVQAGMPLSRLCSTSFVATPS
jgi:hypothetical protein